MTLYHGIDVSLWQGDIDWNRIKQNTDIEFAIVRVSAGTKKDKNFSTNMNRAAAAGIHLGVYIYSLATSIDEAIKEADFVINTIKPYTIQYPVYYDIEDTIQSKLTNDERTSLIQAFCNRIQSANYISGVYSSSSWFQYKFNLNQLKKYEKWVAHWGVATPSYDGAYGMWQYSSTGKIEGISGNVDLNYCYLDYKNYPQNYIAGTQITLKDTPVYTSSIDQTSTKKLTGTYYLYDGILMNNRFRITNAKKSVNALPIGQHVTGYVLRTDIIK